MKITIKDKEVELRYTLRAMMMYENITDSTFNPTNVTEILTFFYCIVVTSAKDYEIKFDEFMTWTDDKPNILNEFAVWLQSTMATQNFVKKN